MMQRALQCNSPNEELRQQREQTLLNVQGRSVRQAVARKMPRRGTPCEQGGNEMLGPEPGRSPPAMIKGRAGELVWRYDLGAVEDLARRMACDAGQRCVAWCPVDKAAHDFWIGSRRVHVYETVSGIVDSKNNMRSADSVAAALS